MRRVNSSSDLWLLHLEFRCIPAGEQLRDHFAALAPAERSAVAGASALSAAALEMFEGWDGRIEVASAGASVYELVAEALGGLLLAHLLAAVGLKTEGADAEAALQLYKGTGMYLSLAPLDEGHTVIFPHPILVCMESLYEQNVTAQSDSASSRRRAPSSAVGCAAGSAASRTRRAAAQRGRRLVPRAF